MNNQRLRLRDFLRCLVGFPPIGLVFITLIAAFYTAWGLFCLLEWARGVSGLTTKEIGKIIELGGASLAIVGVIWMRK